MISIGSFFTRIMQIETLRRQSIVTLSTTIALTLIGFASTMYFAHSIGASVLGVYFLFLAYFNIFNLVIDGGFGGAAIKRISEGNEKNEYFSALIALRFLMLFVSVGILLLLKPYLEEIDISGMFNWLIAALIIGIFWSNVSNGNYGSGKVGINQTCGFLNSIGKIIIQVAAVFLGFGAAGLAGGFVFGMIAGTLVGFHFLDLRIVGFKKAHLKSLFSFSFWTFLASSGSLVYRYADTLIIGHFLETADVGIYRVAFQFTSIAGFSTIAIKTVLYPKVSNWSANQKLNLAENALTKAFTYSLLLAIPVLVGGLIFGDKLLYVFYGQEFAKGAVTLYVLLAVQLVNVFMFLQTMYLNGMNHPKESFKVTAVAASANIVLDVFLIPLMGILGAALATLFTMILNSVLAYRVLHRIIDVRIQTQSIRNIVISSLFMGLFVGVYRSVLSISSIWQALIPVVIGGTVYMLLLLKLDYEIQKEIKTILEQIGVSWPKFVG